MHTHTRARSLTRSRRIQWERLGDASLLFSLLHPTIGVRCSRTRIDSTVAQFGRHRLFIQCRPVVTSLKTWVYQYETVDSSQEKWTLPPIIIIITVLSAAVAIRRERRQYCSSFFASCKSITLGLCGPPSTNTDKSNKEDGEEEEEEEESSWAASVDYLVSLPSLASKCYCFLQL